MNLIWPVVIFGGGFLLFQGIQQGRRAYESLDWNITGVKFRRIGLINTEMELTISITNESDLTPTFSNLLVNLSRNGNVFATVRSTERVKLLARDFTELVVPFTVSNTALLSAAADALINRRVGDVKATGVLTVAGLDYRIDEPIEITMPGRDQDEKTSEQGTDGNSGGKGGSKIGSPESINLYLDA